MMSMLSVWTKRNLERLWHGSPRDQATNGRIINDDFEVLAVGEDMQQQDGHLIMMLDAELRTVGKGTIRATRSPNAPSDGNANPTPSYTVRTQSTDGMGGSECGMCRMSVGTRRRRPDGG